VFGTILKLTGAESVNAAGRVKIAHETGQKGFHNFALTGTSIKQSSSRTAKLWCVELLALRPHLMCE
jgi:hypothetical protein